MNKRISIPRSLAVAALLASASGVWAQVPVPVLATQGFADTCFSPFLTAETARSRLMSRDIRVEFYDLLPFSDAAPSPVTGRAATGGTDRRCEVAFDGDHGVRAAQAAMLGLTTEGITSDAALPTTHSEARVPGTTLLAARNLNPKRIAVVHTGTRPGPNGIETFLMVERMTPLEPVQ